MTKVSMRHLNEIVRERNQYSRDALEAWQDFINLKGRMDTELGKVTKRNNFLVEELESWKQQFLKFQAFAEQLTKETTELKAKIENGKRENRRLTSLIDQQKDDTARLTVRLSGTEKQRDDALEALVLQQEIAEELERERKRNKKELAALQHTNATILRQRDEANRVVVHLRSLISGQAHHMEHIVRSLNKAPELTDFIEEGFEDLPEDDNDGASLPDTNTTVAASAGRPTSFRNSIFRASSRTSSRAFSRASTVDGNGKPLDGEDVSPEMESRLLAHSPTPGGSPGLQRKRLSQASVTDVADRHLRDKTDAIADIIRNISEQCAAAVEGLHMAQDADEEETDALDDDEHAHHHHHKTALPAGSEDGHHATSSVAGSEAGSESQGLLGARDMSNSSIPPTPDLVHRSSTSLSMASSSGTTPERHSGSFQQADVPTKIVEDEGEALEGQDEHGDEHAGEVFSGKGQESLIRRPGGARISALGTV